MSTPILKSLTFVPQPKISSDPLIIKRERMVSRLEDQKKLLADPTYRKRRPRPIRKDLEGRIATRWRHGLQIR